VADTAASFQEAVVDMLIRAALAAAESTGIHALTLTGGVACNTRLREKLSTAGDRAGVSVYLTPKSLCTDNAAMIAGAAHAYAAVGRFDDLSVEAVPN
jgi:N6-L-threonylcarbamoyladenine synthase